MIEQVIPCPACGGLEYVNLNGWNKDGTAFNRPQQNCGVCKGKGVVVKLIDNDGDEWIKSQEDANTIAFMNLNKCEIKLLRK